MRLHNLGLWKETVTRTVDLSHVNPSAVEALVDFLYTGRCTVRPPWASDLLYLGEEFGLLDGGLKEICERALLDGGLSETNILPRYLTARTFGLDHVTNACGRFLVARPDFFKSGQWTAFEQRQPQAAAELKCQVDARRRSHMPEKVSCSIM